MSKSNLRKRHILIFLGLSLLLNLFLLRQILQPQSSSLQKLSQIDVSSQYPLLAKRIVNELPVDILINFLDLRDALQKKAEEYKGDFGLYFEYLPTGVNIGVNDESEFAAASLFKLPVVMAYFSHKERTGMKDTTVSITEDQIDNRFGNLWQKGAGYKIDLDEAARMAIVDSDNTATRALGPYIADEDFKKVYDALDIEYEITNKGALVTSQHYASVLKALYFSAVLTRDNSQKILDYLTQSNFDDKLVAGIPPDVIVAHKIGVVEEEAYMDCGIVYVPRRNYLLCMVSKSDEKTARDRMKLISKTVYDYVTSAGK